MSLHHRDKERLLGVQTHELSQQASLRSPVETHTPWPLAPVSVSIHRSLADVLVLNLERVSPGFKETLNAVPSVLERRSCGVRTGRLKRYDPSLQARHVWRCRQQEAASPSQCYEHCLAHSWILNSDSQNYEKRFVCVPLPGFWAFLTHTAPGWSFSSGFRPGQGIPALLVTLQCRRTSLYLLGVSRPDHTHWAALDTPYQEFLVSLVEMRQLEPRQVPEYKVEDSIGLISRRVGARRGGGKKEHSRWGGGRNTLDGKEHSRWGGQKKEHSRWGKEKKEHSRWGGGKKEHSKFGEGRSTLDGEDRRRNTLDGEKGRRSI
jgi:hypothetical protein